jgi:hypothetical protein
MSGTIYVVATDTKPLLNFTLKDSNGIAVNITGCTIRFKIRAQGSATNTNNASNTCTIVSAANGTFYYAFASTDLPSAGTYLGQLQITFADTKVHRVPKNIRIEVTDAF